MSSPAVDGWEGEPPVTPAKRRVAYAALVASAEKVRKYGAPRVLPVAPALLLDVRGFAGAFEDAAILACSAMARFCLSKASSSSIMRISSSMVKSDIEWATREERVPRDAW